MDAISLAIFQIALSLLLYVSNMPIIGYVMRGRLGRKYIINVLPVLCTGRNGPLGSQSLH